MEHTDVGTPIGWNLENLGEACIQHVSYLYSNHGVVQDCHTSVVPDGPLSVQQNSTILRYCQLPEGHC